MLIHYMEPREERRDGAELAKVSFSQEAGYGAVGAGENRTLGTLGPGGYRWRPQERETLLVFHTGDGDFCGGVTDQTTGLAPGEIKISGPKGSMIWFKADGTVEINGQSYPLPAAK